MNQLRGFTLVEMLVSISMGSVLMMLALGMVHRSMHHESAARRQTQTERTATRLSRQFRHDIHQAESISLDQQHGSAVLQLALPDQPPVFYKIKSGHLLREQPQASGSTYRELYAFPEDHVLRFAELTQPARAVLTLIYDTQLVGVAPQVKLQVEAVIGQFLRLSQPEEIPQ